MRKGRWGGAQFILSSHYVPGTERYFYSFNQPFIHSINSHICSIKGVLLSSLHKPESWSELKLAQAHRTSKPKNQDWTQVCVPHHSATLPLQAKRKHQDLGAREKWWTRSQKQEETYICWRASMDQLLHLNSFHMKIYLHFLRHDHYHIHFKTEKTKVSMG